MDYGGCFILDIDQYQSIGSARDYSLDLKIEAFLERTTSDTAVYFIFSTQLKIFTMGKQIHFAITIHNAVVFQVHVCER